MWPVIVCLLLALVYYKGFKPYDHWKRKGVRSTRPWPFLGDLAPSLFRRKALAHNYEDIYRLYPDGRYVGMYNMTSPTLMLRDPDLIKRITVKEFEKFPHHRAFLPEDVDPLWSKNLFAMRGGEKWRSMRSTLSPAYTSSKMKLMFELMKECTENFCRHFAQTESSTVEMKDAFTRIANDVIATTAFGVTCDSLRDRDNEFYLMGKDVTGITGMRILAVALHSLSPTLAQLLGLRMFDKKTYNFYGDLISTAIKIRQERNIVRPDMIHLLMEAKKGKLKCEEEEEHWDYDKGRDKAPITDEDILAQTLVFYFAGFDTVSTTLAHCTYELALNPEVQTKLYREIDEALAETDGKVTYDIVAGIKYLEMVLQETLRKWPPFVSSDRQSVQPFAIERDGEEPLLLEKGSTVLIPIYAIQRDPANFPEPERFDPERFSDANKANIKPFTFLPFGAGPRICIGARFAMTEMKLILAEIVRKFEFVPVKKSIIPITISKRNFNPVCDEGFWLGMKTRNFDA